MAIVPDLSSTTPGAINNSIPTGVDRKLATPNRVNAGTPYGVLTPMYAGEMVLDSTAAQLWTTSGGVTSTSWIPVTKVY